MDDLSKQAWIRSAVQQYERPLMRYAVRRTGCEQIARDVVQDTFLKLWQAERQSVDGHLAPWLYTVCRNRARDVCRKERRMRTLEHEPGNRERGTGNRADDKPDAGSRLPDAETSEKHAALFGALKGLSDKQQEAVRLKFQSGLSYREIAEVMDITVNHVGVLLHHAIKAIRETITTGDDGEQPLISEQTG